MNLDSLGEFGLIDLINIPAYAPEQMVLGRGDDCAVLPFDAAQYQVLSCDLLVEDVHFIRKRITPRQLGYKAVAVNLSDVAAMGGRPVHILLSLALPPDYTVEEWQAFYQGVDDICRKYQVNVIGGDTTSSRDKLAINVTVLGLVEKQYLHLRSAAVPGDVVFVTGALGGSRAGLELILRDLADEQDVMLRDLSQYHKESLLQCHCQPEPCCEEIAVLNQLAGPDLHALNDISDGLLSECSEIAEASGSSLVLRPEQVPVHESCAFLADRLGTDGLRWAMSGGEDYQLVGTMAAERAEEICAAYRSRTGKNISIVGFVEPGSGVYLLQEEERKLVKQRGYNHFEAAQEEQAGSTAVPREERITALQELVQHGLQDLAEREEQERVYRHDFSNHLACLAGLLQCGKTEQAKQYLHRMIEAAPRKQEHTYSQRIVLNLLLNQKAKLAEEKGMDVQITCEDGLLDFVNDYDLCTLLGNLLDNGLEHAGFSQEAYLYLDIFGGQAGEVFLRMENSCEKQPVLLNGCLVTQKADRAQHGKGMVQIQRMTEQYGGQFSWTYDAAQKRFVTQCKFSMIS
ncbi:MAG: thiamine-phosphate kinase [Peptococcaceae bacterium]|nr:thiamine-phosphate kinase [Peptococcaceae bacterium]